MGYGKKIYRFWNSNEYEFGYAGKYGARGEKRAPRRKATPEQIRKQNQINRVNKVRRLIKANFKPDDLWITLKPPPGKRKSPEQFKRDLKNFLNAMLRAYKARKTPFQWIYRLEIGKRGGIHCHILINRIRGYPETDILVRDKWQRYGGSVSYESIYEKGGYQDLAEYITKQPDEAVEKQLSFFEEDEHDDYVRYHSSRNLIRPEPEIKEYSARTMRRLVEEGPKPQDGYYIDWDSVVCGINPYTGMSYYRYTEIRLKEINRSMEWEADDG